MAHVLGSMVVILTKSLYQVMDLNGKVLPGATAEDFSKEEARKMYQTMVRVQALDDVFYNAQVLFGIADNPLSLDSLSVRNATASRSDLFLYAKCWRGGFPDRQLSCVG